MRKKKEHELPFIRSMAPANIPGDQDRFNHSANFDSFGSASSSQSSSGGNAPSCESLELPDVEIEPLTQDEITPEINYDLDQSIASMLTSAICQTWENFSSTSSMISICQESGYNDIAEVIKSIAAEQITHIGKLQKSLESILPSILLIDLGEANAELRLNEELEVIENEELDDVERALGVTLSLTQRNYIIDKWRAFYDEPEKYPELVDIIKDEMNKDGIFVESVFNRKLEENMKITKLNDYSRDNLVDQESNITDGTELDSVISATKKHYKDAGEVFTGISRCLNKDGGIMGAKKQPMPEKVTYPKTRMTEARYMSPSEFDAMVKADQEIEDKAQRRFKNKGEIDAARRDWVDPDLDIPFTQYIIIQQLPQPISDELTEYVDPGVFNAKIKELQLRVQKAAQKEGREITDDELKKLDKAIMKTKDQMFDKAAEYFDQKYGLLCTIATFNYQLKTWKISLQGDMDKLDAFMDDAGVTYKTYKIRDYYNDQKAKEQAAIDRGQVTKSGKPIVRSENSDTIRDLYMMLGGELSNNPNDSNGHTLFGNVSSNDKYISELTGAALGGKGDGKRNYELWSTPTGYRVGVDNPDRLEFAYDVADAYKPYGVLFNDKVRRDGAHPGKPYQVEFTVPSWASGIDITGSNLKKLQKSPTLIQGMLDQKYPLNPDYYPEGENDPYYAKVKAMRQRILQQYGLSD